MLLSYRSILHLDVIYNMSRYYIVTFIYFSLGSTTRISILLVGFSLYLLPCFKLCTNLYKEKKYECTRPQQEQPGWSCNSINSSILNKCITQLGIMLYQSLQQSLHQIMCMCSLSIIGSSVGDSIPV